MNNNNQIQKNKIENILEKIENNELVLKPKIYFHIKFLALVILLTIIVIISIFLSSFILFSLNAGGRTSLMGFGLNGWQVFFILFPWKLALLEITLIICLEYFLRSFRFGYKVPVLYLFFGVITLIIIIGILVEQTPLHSKILRQADKEHLPPPFSNLYKDVRRPPARNSGIFSGTVETIDELSLVVNLDNPKGRGTTTSVIVNFLDIREKQRFTQGDKILIRGQFKEGQIRAIQIKKVRILQ